MPEGVGDWIALILMAAAISYTVHAWVFDRWPFA